MKRTSKRHRGDDPRKQYVFDYVNAARNRPADNSGKQQNIVRLLAMKEDNVIEFDPPRLGERCRLSR